MKNFLVSVVFAVSLLVPLAFAPPALAAVDPAWDVTGHYVATYMYLGLPYAHDMDLVQDGAGNITGSGGYPAGGPYSYHWNITSGSVHDGDQVDLTILYDVGAAGTIMHMQGTIAADGTISGDWDDNYGGSRVGTWFTSLGAANVTNVPDWGQQLSAARCVGKVGSPVINITQKVTNDVDSGMAGNNWAFDNYNRHIQVWRTGTNDSNTFCALVTYEGMANAVAGQIGPGGTGTIGEGVTAKMKGGYRSAVFTGNLKSSPTWRTRGSVGTVDYQCDLSGNCPGYVSWLDTYFSDVSGYDLDWWGWFYYGGSHGNWLNSSEGTFGNIL